MVSALVQHEKPPLAAVVMVANSASLLYLLLVLASGPQAAAASEQFQFPKELPMVLTERGDEVAQLETWVVLCEGKELVLLSVEEADGPSTLD